MAKNIQKIKPKPKQTVNSKNCSCVNVSLCITGVHDIAQNGSDNFRSYPSGKHYCSDAVHCRGRISVNV